MRSLVMVLAAMTCCYLTSASPTLQSRSLLPEGVPLPDGVPLELLFAACGDSTAENDIGPCVETLLQGIIELATPSFSSGLEVGGKTIVLEPLTLKDIETKGKKKSLQITGRNIQVSGLSSLNVQNVSLLPDELAFILNFTQLNASADLTARWKFISASPGLLLTLNQPSIHFRSTWELGVQDGKLAISFSNVTVDIEIESFSTKISDLPGLGSFISAILNSSNQLLLDLFEPKLEEKAKKLLEKEFHTIKLGRI